MAAMLTERTRFFLADGSADTSKLGMRTGTGGTHTSRTLMFQELALLFSAVPASATRVDYAAAIVEMNCLGKLTASTRRITNQRLGELFCLDSAWPLFRVFRRLWDLDPAGRRLLAMQCAIARDPLLAATAATILPLAVGADFQRETTTAALRELAGDRMNEAVLAKVVRNTASSWAQSGHLVGRTFKTRCRVQATPATAAFSLFLGNAAGFRGLDLFTSGWMKVLDCSATEARDLAIDSKRIGLIDFRIAGKVLDLNLERLDPNGPRN